MTNDPWEDLRQIVTKLAEFHRQLGMMRGQEKRSWATTFQNEFNATPNISAASRVADSFVSEITATRYETEGEIAALTAERDYLIFVLTDNPPGNV